MPKIHSWMGTRLTPKESLSRHWSTAMCVSEESRILEHIIPETRDDLLMLDAMCRKILTPQTSFCPIVKNRLANDMRRAMMDRLLDEKETDGSESA